MSNHFYRLFPSPHLTTPPLQKKAKNKHKPKKPHPTNVHTLTQCFLNKQSAVFLLWPPLKMQA